jgi:chaperonin GroEL (HSP60 family)
MQRQEAGDGTATFVVFLSALLKKADALMNMKIHPNTIVHGYHVATEKAQEILEKEASEVTDDYDVLDVIDCKRNLLTPKIRMAIREAYPLAFVDGHFDPDNIRFLRRSGGEIDQSNLIQGVVIKKPKAHPNMPDSLKQLRIALTSQRLGFDRLELKMKGEGQSQCN